MTLAMHFEVLGRAAAFGIHYTPRRHDVKPFAFCRNRLLLFQQLLELPPGMLADVRVVLDALERLYDAGGCHLLREAAYDVDSLLARVPVLDVYLDDRCDGVGMEHRPQL